MSTNDIRIEGLEYGFPATGPILAISQLTIAHGERVFVEGPSGVGKTSLLSLISGLVLPQAGEIRIGDDVITNLTSAERDRFRANRIGLIYQMFNLIPYLTALQNVTLAADLAPERLRRAAQSAGGVDAEAGRLLDSMGISAGLHNRFPSELSVGQQQRVAAARAFIGSPGILVADEPTSALDDDAAEKFMGALMSLAKQSQATVLLVSHDRSLAEYFDRTIDLRAINGVAACA